MFIALMAASWYWFWGSCPFYTLWQTANKPLCIAFFLGLVTGNMTECMIIGATIQGIYLGVINPGGAYSADAAIATCVAIPVAINSGLTPESAVALAVPVGLLGATAAQIRYILNGYFATRADNHAEKLNTVGIMRNAALYPYFVNILVKFMPVFLAVYFGTSLVSAIFDSIPAWVQRGLTVSGGILPAIGFALTISVINQNDKKLLPFFVIGFFATKLLGVSTMAAAIFSISIALLFVFFQKETNVEAN